MASDSGVPKERLDERLALARDDALLDGESVVAQEPGDQGQAVILTNLRVLIIKVGITATGVSNGKVVGEFPLTRISAVNVRKGPLGAVIQICTNGKPPATPVAAPDNVIVFTGAKRMRMCEFIAAKIESALGKPVGRIEPSPEAIQVPVAEPSVEAPAELAPAEPAQEPSAAAPEASHSEVDEPRAESEPPAAEPEAPSEPPIGDMAKGRRQPQSLADEIFADTLRAQSLAEKVRAQSQADAALAQSRARQGAETVEVHPNPKLPRPACKSSARNKVLVMLGLLIAVLVVGVGTLGPLRVTEQIPMVDLSLSDLANNSKLLRRQRDAVERYAKEARATVDVAVRTLAALESALITGNKAAAVAAIRGDAVEGAWRRLDKGTAPPGLAEARDQLLSGLFIGKTTIANLSGAIQSDSPVDLKAYLAKTVDARSRVARGLVSIEQARRGVERQLKEEAELMRREVARTRRAPNTAGR